MEESSIPFDFIPDPLSSPLSSPPSTQETPIEDSKQASPPSTCPNSETTMIAEPPIQRGKTFSEYIPEAHRADLIEAKKLIRELVPQMLDVKLLWSEQKPSARQELLSTVSSSCPILSKYANKWPLVHYAYQVHCRLRTNARRAGEISRSKKRTNILGDFPYGTEESRNVPNPLSLCSSCTLTAATSSTPAGSNDGTFRPCGSTTNHTTSSLRTTSRSIQHDTGRASQSTRAGTVTNGRKEVEEFLQSLPLQVGHLTERFLSAGLCDRARLDMMSKWTVADQEMFLRREVATDPFLVKVVCDALRSSRFLVYRAT